MKKVLISLLVLSMLLCSLVGCTTASKKTDTTGTSSPATGTTATSTKEEKFSISSESLMLFVKESTAISTNGDKTTWECTDPSVAKVDDKGNVYALKKGKCTVNVKNEKGESAKCEITVIDAADYITLPDLKTLTINKQALDKEVQAEFDYMAKYFAEKVANDEKKIENGDIVNITFVGKLVGSDEPFEGGTGTDNLEIGSGSFIKGFEEGLIGYEKGSELTLHLTFPEDYVDPEKDKEKAEMFNGKEVEFKVTVNRIYELVPAEITDKLVYEATNGAYHLVSDYRAYIEDSLREYLCLEEAIAKSEIKGYDDELVKYYNEIYIMNSYGMYAQYYGMTPIEFAMKMYGYTEEQVYEEATKNTKAYLEQLYLVYSLIADDSFTVTDEARTKLLEDYAAQNGFKSVDELKEKVNEGFLSNYVNQETALSLVKDYIKVVDTAEEK